MTLVQWILWEAQNAKKDEKKEKQLVRKLKKIFAQLKSSVRKEVESFYARYGIEWLVDAKKMADLDEQIHYNEKNLSRIDALNRRLQEQYDAAYQEVDDFFTESLTDITQTELDRQEKALGFMAGTLIGRQIARSISSEPYYNATYNQRLEVEKEVQRLSAEQILLQEMIRGGNVNEVVKKLMDELGLAQYQAERLLRTEAKRAQTEATKYAYEQAGITEYQFCANPDCCDICQGLNGKTYDVKKMTAGDNAPPIHPNCKCWTVPLNTTPEQAQTLENQGVRLQSEGEDGTMRLGMNLFGENDPIYLDSFSIEPEEGFLDIFAHGDGKTKTIEVKGEQMSAEEFASYLYERASYKGQDLKLSVCEAGQGDDSFAQQLSSIMGIKVKAPDMDAFYDPKDGVVHVGAPTQDVGHWRVFDKGEELK